MLIHSSHFQSFLNLGICKEYLIMPRPKSPKKSNGAEVPAVSAGVAPVSTGIGPVETVTSTSAPEGRNAEMKTTLPRNARKPEIVLSESRSKLVPINLEDEIRRLAYLLSERRGFQAGHETEDWLSAEREVLQRYHQQSA
jgi:hypothetical protein